MAFIELGENPALLFADRIFDFTDGDPLGCRDAQTIVTDQESDRPSLGTQQCVVQRMFAQLNAAFAVRWTGWRRRDRIRTRPELGFGRRRQTGRRKKIQLQRKLVGIGLSVAEQSQCGFSQVAGTMRNKWRAK